MLRKSIRHEFRASARVMLPLFAALILLSLFAHLSIAALDSGNSSFFESMLATLTLVVYLVSLIAVCVGVIALTAVRFYRSIFSDEGYLTMTLPVSTHKTICARLIVSVIWYALTALAVILSVLLLGTGDWGDLFSGVWQLLRAVLDGLRALSGQQLAGVIGLVLEVFLLVVVGCASFSLLVYAALAIGYSFQKHKRLMSVVFFFVLQYASRIVNILLVVFFFRPGSVLQLLPGGFTLGIAYTIFSAGLFLSLVLCAIYYTITHYFIHRRLNLE